MSRNYLWIDEKIGKTKAYKIVPETIYVSISKYSLGNASNIFFPKRLLKSPNVFIAQFFDAYRHFFSFRIYDTQSKIGQKGRLEISAPHKSPLFRPRSLIIGRDLDTQTCHFSKTSMFRFVTNPTIIRMMFACKFIAL